MEEDSQASLILPPTMSLANSPALTDSNTATLHPQRERSTDFLSGPRTPSTNPRTTEDRRYEEGGSKKRRRTGAAQEAGDTPNTPFPKVPLPTSPESPAPHPLGISLTQLGMTSPALHNPSESPLPPTQQQHALAQYFSPNVALGLTTSTPVPNQVHLYTGEPNPQIPLPPISGCHIPDARVTGFLSSRRPKVTAPMAAKTQDQKKSTHNRRPWCYLVTGLSEENADYICDEAFISNKHATIHVLRFNPTPSHYVGRIRNLTYKPSQCKTIEALIRAAIHEDPNIREFITKFTTSYNDLVPPSVTQSGEMLAWIVDSVKVYDIQNSGTPGRPHTQWKWYIFTPTRIPEQVANWTRTLLELPIHASVFGYGKILTDHKCVRCKSTNHSSEECTFDKQSNFINTTSTTKAPGNIPRGGGKGRGRGRGSRGTRRAIFD